MFYLYLPSITLRNADIDRENRLPSVTVRRRGKQGASTILDSTLVLIDAVLLISVWILYNAFYKGRRGLTVQYESCRFKVFCSLKPSFDGGFPRECWLVCQQGEWLWILSLYVKLNMTKACKIIMLRQVSCTLCLIENRYLHTNLNNNPYRSMIY